MCTCSGVHVHHTHFHDMQNFIHSHILTCHNYSPHCSPATCNIFGNNLIQTTAASNQGNGLYMNIRNAASCPGNITRWNVCYYSANSNATMTSYFAIYRPTNGSNYRRVGQLLPTLQPGTCQSPTSATIFPFPVPTVCGTASGRTGCLSKEHEVPGHGRLQCDRCQCAQS